MLTFVNNDSYLSHRIIKDEQKNAQIFKVQIARLVIMVGIPLKPLRSLFFGNIKTIPVLRICKEPCVKMFQLT